MAKARKPSEAQIHALIHLFRGTPHGVEFWYDAKQIEREATWLACIKYGWVENADTTSLRLRITDAGRVIVEALKSHR
jgi:hypothetical protein